MMLSNYFAFKMSYYEPYHSCAYKTISIDELRLKSLLRRSEGLRSLDKAFEDAQNKIQEQVESRNSCIEARLSQLNEASLKAESHAKKLTPYKIKSELMHEVPYSRAKAAEKAKIFKAVSKETTSKHPSPHKEIQEHPRKQKSKTPEFKSVDLPVPIKEEIKKSEEKVQTKCVADKEDIPKTDLNKTVAPKQESEKPQEVQVDPTPIKEKSIPQDKPKDEPIPQDKPKDEPISPMKPEVLPSEPVKEESSAQENTKPIKDEPIFAEKPQELPSDPTPAKDESHVNPPELLSDSTPAMEELSTPEKPQEMLSDSTSAKEELSTPAKPEELPLDSIPAKEELITPEKAEEPLPTSSLPKEEDIFSAEMTGASHKKNIKPPELVLEPSEDSPDKINQILECDSVLDATSKALSPFEQNLVAFGQHFNFIPAPEPEKWEDEEDVTPEAGPLEGEEAEAEEEELTPYQAALKKKYDEEVCMTKTASWGGEKSSRSKYDMSFLNVNQGEEIIHGNLFTQFQSWIKAMREEEIDEKALASIKSHQNDPVSEDYLKIDPHLKVKDRSDYIYVGEKNSLAMPHGDGEINFQNGDYFKGGFLNGERYGLGVLRVSTEDKSLHTISSIEGTYAHDHLEGPAKIIHKNGSIQHAFCSKGCLHGISKLFDKDYNIIEMGWYHSGAKEGQFWRFLTGGSVLVGGLTETGKIGGDEVVYLYPDLKTCFKGTFVDEKMLLGQVCYVEVALKKKDIYFIKTTTPKGPNYKYDPSTSTQLCELDPLLPDPYEYNCVYIKQSRMKDAGEGIFAIRDFYKGEIVSFYNGVKLNANQMGTSKDEWEKNAYKIMDLLGKNENGEEGVIDIPPEFVPIDKYKASLSHKANHSFEPNAKFILFEHPRFGKIPSLVITTEAVAHDKEITVSYDYAMEDSPPWYQDLYTQNMLNMYQESKNFEG